MNEVVLELMCLSQPGKVHLHIRGFEVLVMQVRPPHVTMCHDLHVCHTGVIFV